MVYMSICIVDICIGGLVGAMPSARCSRAFVMDPAISAVLSENALGKLIKEACEVWKNGTGRHFDMYFEGFWFFFDDGMLSLERQHKLGVDDDEFEDPGGEDPCKRSKGVEPPCKRLKGVKHPGGEVSSSD